MTQQEIDQAYNRIVRSLDNKELKDAFDSLQALIATGREYVFQEKLSEIQDTYRQLLHYRMDGVKDPMQEDIYRNIRIAAYELAGRLKHRLLIATSASFFYNLKRHIPAREGNQIPDNLCRQLVHACHQTANPGMYEETLVELFLKIWTADMFTPADNTTIKELWSNRNLPFTAGCLAVSALTLALQENFDKEKLLLLFDAIHFSGNEEVSIRALIGILLTLYLHRERTSLYPQITERLETLAETPRFSQKLQTITLRFILARDTEEITRKLREEIIPDMIKLNPRLGEKMNPNDINPELTDEKNPEWKEISVDATLEKRMEEFSELQQEGADIMHFTFIHLKNFPFFREISNWFMPFTPEHSLFNNRHTNGKAERNLAEAIKTISFMCNSDKYSLYFSMAQWPEDAQLMVTGQFNQQVTEIMNQYSDEWHDAQKRLEIISGQYIQDLYRFFKLFPARHDFDDIFIWPFDFHNLPILKPYMSDQESLMAIATYYLGKNYLNDAQIIFTELTETQKENDMLFQKLGYCLQMNGDIKGALKAYLHANLLNPKNKWLIRRIAGCYRSLKQPGEALVYYRHYEELFPNELSMQIGHCYLALKDYNEALKYYFKADYLDPQNHKAWRAIAWCSFLTGRFEQARSYYKKTIAEAHPDMHDFLNAGHTEWALQNNKKAAGYYLQAIRNEDGANFPLFKEQFYRDLNYLKLAGIRDCDIPLMLDQLSFLSQ